jgi:hypothetical protein
MTLDEVGKKYRISNSYLNTKTDALSIASTSVNEIITQIQSGIPASSLVENLKKLSSFLHDVKNSNM